MPFTPDYVSGTCRLPSHAGLLAHIRDNYLASHIHGSLCPRRRRRLPLVAVPAGRTRAAAGRQTGSDTADGPIRIESGRTCSSRNSEAVPVEGQEKNVMYVSFPFI